MNPKIAIAKSRALLTQKVRDFFTGQNFTEVETPIMVPIPGMEPHLTPFETKLSLPAVYSADQSNKSLRATESPDSDSPLASTKTLYLNTSPELQMKKLLGAGFGNIFNITKVFRNGEIGGPLHNPEFTMIEWYRENAGYIDLMTDCENLILELIKIKTPTPDGQHPSPTLPYQSQLIDLTPPWPRLSTSEAFQKYCNINLLKNRDFKTFKNTANKLNFDTNGCETWDDIYFKIFLNHIEPNLPISRPVFLYDYPATQAALAKTCAKNPFFAERFELYIAGIELTNAFSELTDVHEQRQRLIEEQNLRKSLKKPIFPIDEEFLTALSQIQNPCAGIALGLDRLFMLLLNKKTINDVLLFPPNL